MTKSEIATRAHNYDYRIRAIVTAQSKLKPLEYATEHLTLSFMLHEYEAKLKDLHTAKEYMITFEGGGWNTCYGVSDEEALANAKEEYEGPGCADGCKVKSVRLATQSGIDAAMRNFY
jgi:hypothetical protein